MTIYFSYRGWIKGLKTAAKELVTESKRGKREYRNILSGLSRELEKQNLLMKTKKALINILDILGVGNSSRQQW